MLRALHGKAPVFNLFADTMRKFITPDQLVNRFSQLIDTQFQSGVVGFDDYIGINTQTALHLFLQHVGHINYHIAPARTWEDDLNISEGNIDLFTNALCKIRSMHYCFSEPLLTV